MKPVLELVAGRTPALEVLRAGKRSARKLFLLRGGQQLEPLRSAAAYRNVPIEEVDRNHLNRMAGGGVHQGVLLQTDPLPLPDLKGWLARAGHPTGPLVVLDEVEDPQNFGGIIRSVAALGGGGVVFGKDRAAPVSTAAVKAAAGAAEYVDLLQVPNIPRALDMLKEASYWILGLDVKGPATLWEVDLMGPRAIVIGSEGRGIRKMVLERCDMLGRIPIAGPITSLNASVSAALALAECARQRAAGAGLRQS